MENKGASQTREGIGREIRKLARENYGVQKRTNYGISPESASGAATLPDRPSGWKGRARAGNGRSLCVATAGQGQSQGGDGRQGGGERFGHVPPTTAIIETVETFKLLKPCPPSSRTFRSF